MARETIKNPSLDVYNTWKTAMEPVVGVGNAAYGASMTVANTKKHFARLTVMGTPARSVDLYGNENATDVSVQVEYFSTKGLNELYSIEDAGHKAMVGMGFRKTFGPELIDNIDTSIKRVISRYTLLYTGTLS